MAVPLLSCLALTAPFHGQPPRVLPGIEDGTIWCTATGTAPR